MLSIGLTAILNGVEREETYVKNCKRTHDRVYTCGRVKADSILSRFYRSDYDLFLNRSLTYSTKAKQGEEESQVTDEGQEKEKFKTFEDFQHEEIVGPTVERDTSPVADELRKTHLEIREVINKFSKSILAVGVVHLIWGGMMFRVIDSSFSHALLTQVCLSSFVFFGLSYYSRQTLKPLEFFTKLEERSRLRMITLSLQVTKTFSAFFQRSYGINLALSLALTANLLGCIKFFFSF
jgi:hypothetical protein